MAAPTLSKASLKQLKPKFVAQAAVDIGRSQAEDSRRTRTLADALTPGQERERKLDLGKAAARNIIEGTVVLNRLKRNQSTDSKN